MKTNNYYNANRRRFRIITAITTAIVVAIGSFAVLLCYKLDWSFDMTTERLFTLSEQTVSVLRGLDENVDIAGVYATGKEEQMIQSLLGEYTKASDKINVEYIDAERDPGKLASYALDVTSVANGSVIVKSAERSDIISGDELFEEDTDGSRLFAGEREITGAIRYVTSEEMPAVYFVQGNGETDYTTYLTEAASDLDQSACEVRSLRLTEGEAIPKDAAMLIFVSPQTDISDEALIKLQDYSRKGGSIFLMIDPVTSSNEVNYTNLSKFTNEYGIDITNNFVVEEDPQHYLSQRNTFLIPLYGEHEIVTDMAKRQGMVILPSVRALGTGEYDTSEITNTVLLQSSNTSWCRNDMTVKEPQFTENDHIGPWPLAFASVKSNVKWGENASRMVVIGNSIFSYDSMAEVQTNRELFMNCALWLLGNRESEIIATKSINSGSVIIRGSEFVSLAIVCVAVLPGIAFALALVVGIRRRNQ